MEKKVQTKIIKRLRSNGFYVIKTRPGPGTPVGCLDVLFMKEGFWGSIECKAYEDSAWRPGQEVTFKRFSEWSWARVAHSGNVEEVCLEIDALA